jgi:acetyl-CoA carboxylase biotin carboxylase subunit
MGECAVKVARAVNYVGAGTVEFLVSDIDKSFYFLEMNTRLQVEHPVTEMITGIDLVREQINVAAGKPLSFSQEEVRLTGHAIECRIYAEDPENNFLPSPGKILRLRVPQGPGVRDDGGVYEGADVSIFYDPMISKFAVWGRNREEAIDRMLPALDEYQIAGIKTTLPFFREVIRDEEFIAGRIDTGFIPSFLERRTEFETDTQTKNAAIIAAALAATSRNAAARIDLNPAESKWRKAARAAGPTDRLSS